MFRTVRKLVRRLDAGLEDQQKLVTEINRSFGDMSKMLKDVRWELQQQRKWSELQRMHLMAPVFAELQDFCDRQQLGFRDTVVRLAETEESFARFGDGEFKLMLRNEYNLRFQRWSEGLARELRETLGRSQEEGLLVGFPNPYRDLHWSGVWTDIWAEIKPMLPAGATFGNSHVTRPIFFQIMGSEGVDLWRKVWSGRDVLVITGRGSRFERHPHLFDNVASWTEVFSTPQHAYDDLPRLLDEIDGHDASALHLVALGPAGTVLAAALKARGRRAIDVGHISDSYSTVFEGAAWPESKAVTRDPAAAAPAAPAAAAPEADGDEAPGA